MKLKNDNDESIEPIFWWAIGIGISLLLFAGTIIIFHKGWI